MQVVVDSLLTHYEISGKGRLIVLLHGWGDSAAGMKSLQQALSERFTVVAVDLPGFGTTEPPKGVWGLTEYAAFVEHFLEKINTGRPYLLVGHSNGGAIAIRALAKGLLEADRLVLLASAGIRGVYRGRVRALRYITKVGKALTMPLPKTLRKTIQKKVYKTVGSDMLVAEHLQETFKQVVTDDVREDAATLTIPVLLVYGERDAATPLWYGQAYHELIPHSTLEVLPGAEHFVHIDRADDVIRAIQEFAA